MIRSPALGGLRKRCCLGFRWCLQSGYMSSATCPMLHVLCYVFYVMCSVLTVLCYMSCVAYPMLQFEVPPPNVAQYTERRSPILR